VAALDHADRDAVILALAILSLDRPGWLQYLRGIAGAIFFDDPRVLAAQVETFDEFRRLNADRWQERAL
jgi:hypothetical protein